MRRLREAFGRGGAPAIVIAITLGGSVLLYVLWRTFLEYQFGGYLFD